MGTTAACITDGYPGGAELRYHVRRFIQAIVIQSHECFFFLFVLGKGGALPAMGVGLILLDVASPLFGDIGPEFGGLADAWSVVNNARAQRKFVRVVGSTDGRDEV